MNIFIVFVKFFGWIVAIWMRLVRLIVEKKRFKVLEGGLTTKMKNIITKKKIGSKGGLGPLGPPPGSVLASH